MALLHFSNLAPSAPKGTLLSVLHDDHQLSPKMNMKKFIVSGGSHQTWPYTFSTVFITDKTKEDLEYLTFAEFEQYIMVNNNG